MARRELIWKLRNVKARLTASGPVGRLAAPVVEICEFWLSHGFREVVSRSRMRLGLRPAPKAHPREPAVAAAGDEPAASAPPSEPIVASQSALASAYGQLLDAAVNRRGPEFVPESPADRDFRQCLVRLIAFYLPQFHPIPENDEWWGRGFTEWRNVAKAVPQFEGHYQPHQPGELGFYDLRVREVQRRQVALARAYGIHGFCFHYYWFNGRRLLERPLDEYVSDATIEFPFCICWANENWTRRWDGLETDVLVSQVHSEDSDIGFIRSVEPLFRDPRYIRINGRPVLVVYRVPLMPNPRATAARWKAYCRSVGLPEPFLVAAQTFGFTDPRTVGFDAAVEFPPHNIDVPEISVSLTFLNPSFEGRVSRYEDFGAKIKGYNANRPYRVFRCVSPAWDNEPRKPGRGYVFADSTPGLYGDWLDTACSAAVEDPEADARLVFINAWNEWGEGAYLEPDLRYGYAYLQTTRDVVRKYANPDLKVSAVVPNYNHARFLERRLQSIVEQSRRPDEVVFLDDASTDESVTIARRVLAASGISHRIITNDGNSGNPFRQWLRGMAEATGDLIWIAESDDDADREFLARLLPAFNREDVRLAYGTISYINADGTPNTDLGGYYDDVDGDRWRRSHVRAAHELFTGDFAVKNLVPNAAGAVFRKSRLSVEEQERLIGYRFAGDWYLYALIARGGSIAYCRDAKSYFRKTEGSASRGAFFTDLHVAEHARLLADLQSIYGVPAATVRRHVDELRRVLSLRDTGEAHSAATEALATTPAAGAHALRICIVSYGFTIGGGELAPVMLANGLKEQGHHVTFLALQNDGGSEPSLRRRLRPDIPVLYWRDCASHFDRVVRDFGFDVINSHNVAVEYEFFRRALRPGIPYVATLHGGYETVPEFMTKPFLSYVDGLVHVWCYAAEKNRQVLAEHGLSHARFVKAFNAVSHDVPAPANVRGRLTIPAGSDVLVLASRAIPEKGWDIAIDAVERVRVTSGRDVHLVLVGEGEHVAAMRTHARGAPWVHFWGGTGDVAGILRECQLGVYPTTYAGESFPLFLLECFAAGLPVVATDVGSIREMVTSADGGSAGAVVPATSRVGIATALASEIQRLIGDAHEMQRARSSAAACAQEYSIERMVGLYLEVFSSLCARRAARSHG